MPTGLPAPEALPKQMTDAQTKAVLLHGIINDFYTDKADEITEYQVKDGVITGKFRDGDRFFTFTINPKLKTDNIEFGLAPESMPQKSITYGEVYDYADKLPPDPVAGIVNQAARKLDEHLATWQKRLEIAQAESADFAEFQERVAAIFEGMDNSRQRIVEDLAKADRTAYLSGIFEAE